MPPVAARQRRTRVLDIRQGDQVLVLTGKDAGKRGVVQHVVTGLTPDGRSTVIARRDLSERTTTNVMRAVATSWSPARATISVSW